MTDQRVAERRPMGVWAQRAEVVARWVGEWVMIVLVLMAVVLMPFWAA